MYIIYVPLSFKDETADESKDDDKSDTEQNESKTDDKSDTEQNESKTDDKDEEGDKYPKFSKIKYLLSLILQVIGHKRLK